MVVGDRVKMELQDDGTAFITEIEDRKNYIVRRSPTFRKSRISWRPISIVLCSVSRQAPVTTTVFIDRFLATAEAYSVPVTLLFNKIDLYEEEELKYLQGMVHLYSSIGYECVRSSMISGEGIGELEACTKGKIVLLAGHSGVGKSTIINRLCGREVQKVREISDRHQMGTHTTTFRR